MMFCISYIAFFSYSIFQAPQNIYGSRCSIQNVHACQSICNTSIVYELHWGGGFGSEFRLILLAHLIAVSTERTFFVDKNSEWFYSNYFSVFKYPHNNCEQPPISQQFISQSFPSDEANYPHIRIGRQYQWFMSHILKNDMDRGNQYPKFLQNDYLRNIGDLYKRRYIAKAMWNFTDRAKLLMGQRREQVQDCLMNKTYIGIAIRRGVANWERNNNSNSISEYAEAADKIFAAKNTVILAEHQNSQ